MMLPKENVLHFIKFNYRPLEKNGILKKLLLLWFCSGITAIFGPLKEILIPIFLIMDLFYTCLCIRALREKTIQEEIRFLIDGFQSLFLSFVGIIASYKIATVSLGNNLILLLTLLLLLMLDIIIFAFVVYSNIKKDSYVNQYTGKKVIIYALAGGIVGDLVSRSYLPEVSATYLPLIVCCCIMILSFLLGIGSLNLLKYYFWKSMMQ